MNSRPPACKAGALPLSYSPGKKKNTNLWNVGLISADRRAKPTLMLTIPRPKVKSSTKDLSLPIFEIMIQHLLGFNSQCVAIIWYMSKTYRYSYNIGRGEYRRFSAWFRT